MTGSLLIDGGAPRELKVNVKWPSCEVTHNPSPWAWLIDAEALDNLIISSQNN